ncbi:FHA domain-containing protein [Candidatus Calescamantes bacterium]|nr:FHA domain-containing protein [Candidatus Calescamantes bacterium]
MFKLFLSLIYLFFLTFSLPARGFLDNIARNPGKMLLLLLAVIGGIGAGVAGIILLTRISYLRREAKKNLQETLLLNNIPKGPVEKNLTLPSAEVVIEEKGRKEFTFFLPVNREIFIGRSSIDNQIIFSEDLTVSRKHAKIRPEKEGFILYDLGSKRGTYVQGKRVKRHVLKEGDRIKIGTNYLTFRYLKEAHH